MKWSENDVVFLTENYGIVKTKDIAKHLGKTSKCVSTKANRLGLTSRLTSKSHKVNNSAFSVLNNDTAYWAGFIAADGCISNKNNYYRLQFAQKAQDAEILEALNKFIDSDYPVKITNKYAKLEIGLINDWIPYLSEYYNLQPNGIDYKKTYDLLPPTALPNLELSLSYIIGFLDGDGSISNRSILRLGFYGTKPVLSWISQTIHLIEDKKYINPAAVSRARNSYSISFTHQRAKNIINTLQTIPLEYRLHRKWNII